MENLLDVLKKRPDLQGIVGSLQTTLLEEKRLRQEFYNTIDEDGKAEFINGEVIMHSPAKFIHTNVSASLFLLLRYYVKKHNLGGVYYEKMMAQLTCNSYEPDIVFFVTEKVQDFKAEQMLFPAPDFIVEVLSPSTEKNDRGVKFEDYVLHNVTEYWLIDPAQKTVEQYFLQNNKYQLEFKGKNGIITSKAINGFAINVRAVFNDIDNMTAMQQLVQE